MTPETINAAIPIGQPMTILQMSKRLGDVSAIVASLTRLHRLRYVARSEALGIPCYTLKRKLEAAE